MTKIINGTPLEFKAIDTEEYREYIFPGGYVIRIDEPTWININSHGHRILDAIGECHYVPRGWIHLKWKAKPGAPHFVI